MEEKRLRQIALALELQHEVVGVRFLDFKADYQAASLPEAPKRGSFCFHIRNAMDGQHYIIREGLVSCDYGRYAVGLSKPDPAIAQGRSIQYCGLCRTHTVARQIAQAMQFIDMPVYGIEVGPLREMDQADIVIIAGFAEAIMRVMQGYAYQYGAPQNLCFYGNQAMCSDMVSKVYHTNDINISLLCRGTRIYGRFDKGELAAAFPIGMLDGMLDGMIKTINPVHSAPDKRRILAALDSPDALGVELDEGYNYGAGLMEYDACAACLRKEEMH